MSEEPENTVETTVIAEATEAQDNAASEAPVDVRDTPNIITDLHMKKVIDAAYENFQKVEMFQPGDYIRAKKEFVFQYFMAPVLCRVLEVAAPGTTFGKIDESDLSEAAHIHRGTVFDLKILRYVQGPRREDAAAIFPVDSRFFEKVDPSTLT